MSTPVPPDASPDEKTNNQALLVVPKTAAHHHSKVREGLFQIVEVELHALNPGRRMRRVLRDVRVPLSQSDVHGRKADAANYVND